MKNFFFFLLAMMGITSACSQDNFESREVGDFARLADSCDVVVLDVRTAEEFAEGHLDGAVNIDVKKGDFGERTDALLPKDKTIALYCKTGRRAKLAAVQLVGKGYRVVSLKGGIEAWKEVSMPVTTDAHERDVFTTPGGKTVKIYALMHASIRIVYDGTEIEIDPVRQLGDRTTDYAALPKSDYLLVTHEHGDHFDTDVLKQLTKVGTRLVCNQRVQTLNGGWGLVMKNGEREQLADGITVEAVPAYNTTAGREQFHPKGRDNGYILTLDGLRIYIAGDTEDTPEMADVRDIDIAFLPCNQPYTMTPDQLVRAARVVRPKVLFPYHYGQTDVSSLPAQLKADGIDVRIRHYE